MSLILGACEKRDTDPILEGVPLSEELRPYIEASRRSLESPEGGDPELIAKIDRGSELWQGFYDKDRRQTAEDSLFAIWGREPESLLLPEIARWNLTFMRDRQAFHDRFARADFPDTSTALGAFLNEWNTYLSGTRGDGFRKAWREREQLTPWQRTHLALAMSWIENQSGNKDAALELALSALTSARDIAGWRLERRAWSSVRSALITGDHLDDALHAAVMAEELVRAISAETANDFIRVNSLLHKADILAMRIDSEPAYEAYAECMRLALESNLRPFANWSLNGAGILTARAGDYERGLDYYRQGLVYCLEDADSLNVPRHMTNIARRHRLLGDLDSCRVYLDKAELWIDAFPAPSNRARFPLMQAEYYAQIGDYETVDSLLAAALRLQPKRSSMTDLAELHLELIKEAIDRGRPGQAYQSLAFLDSLRGRLGASLADRHELFDLELHGAEFYSRQGQFAAASAALSRADSSIRRKPDLDRNWRLARCRGMVARRRGDLQGAENAFESCIALCREGLGGDRLAESRLLLAGLLLDLGRTAELRNILTRDSNEKTFGSRFRTRLTESLVDAISYARDGRYEEARDRLLRLREMTTSSSPPDILVRIGLELGRCHAALHSPEAARNEFEGVLNVVDQEHRRHPLARDVFVDTDLRRELAEAMLDLSFGADDTLVHRPKALASLEDLARLLPAWHREGATGLGELRGPQLIYFVGKESSFRWSITEQELELRRLPGGRELLGLLSPVLSDLTRPTRRVVRAEFEALAEALGGLPAVWHDDETLTIVPDGLLYAVPWSALPWPGHETRAWLDQGPLLLVDSPAGKEDPGMGTARESATLLALSVNGSASARAAGLANLHHAEREAEEVHALWAADRAVLRQGYDADWRRISSNDLSSFAAIHIASHAQVYQGFANRTTLMLAGTSGEPLTADEIGRSSLRADFVFLSSCEAAEAVRRGVGPAHSGLARSFLAAGAKTVIAPSVAIEDEAARHLAKRFHHYWLSGLDAESALRRAQLDLRDGDERWSRPYYWGFHQAIGTDPSRRRLGTTP